ncbi:MAG TPA: tautomerase family protein [Coriobacteriia bacterium]|nr:tautomerase family protein [Coriobacteriia bacterium]
MPIVRIDIQSGKTTAYTRSLLGGVRMALTEALGVPDDRVMQRVIETPAEDIDTTDIKSDRLTIIEISMLSGRGPELKERLYSAIAKRLGFEPGISAHDLIVIVHDPAGECFYLNGAIQCDVPGRKGDDGK